MSIQKKYKHTFVICAYGESPFLEECIQSLKKQTVKTGIKMITSTPNLHIQNLSEKYQIPLYVNEGEKGLAGDWNFALRQADTLLVTLAHQDDLYMPKYAETILKAYQKKKNPIILFTDYAELRGNQTVNKNRLLFVKRMLLFPLRCELLQTSRFIRRRILSMGSPICCPSVTLIKARITEPLFRNNMKSNIDWQAWEELSREEGEFCYLAQPLMKHRIHAGSTTSEVLKNSTRRQEDIYMYRKFWPKPIAEFIELFYSRNEKSNNL